MKYLLILLIPFILSCSAEKRAQRHLRKAIALNPALIQPDTIEINDTITIESFYGDTIYLLNPDTVSLHEIFERFKGKIRQTLADSIKNALQPICVSFKDTLTGVWDSGNIITKIWQNKDGKIGHGIKKYKKEVPYNRILVRTKLVPADCKTKPSDIGWVWIVVILGLFISLVLCLFKK